jgi:glycosyltransferase involved in cell wall biosynthesis
MTVPLQVVEPTLEDYSGHCHSLVSSLVRAARGRAIELWAGQVRQGRMQDGNGAVPMTFGPDVTVHSHFRRRERLQQMLRLLHRLLRTQAPVILTTARTRDLALVALAAPGRLPPDRVFLYFHWLRDTSSKHRLFRFIAARQPDLAVFCTTERLVEVFRGCGFRHVAVLPYPARETTGEESPVPFRRLLYAGAARRDKGFGIVVDLVQRLAATGSDIPIAVQITPDHYGKYDEPTRADITRLEAVHYGPLTLIRQTPSPAEYAANFPGSICLQPYDAVEFADRVSGVTLDALAQGCPIVATAGTWTARLIEPFDAGIALAVPDAEKLHAAAIQLRTDYPRYRSNAFAAAKARDADGWGPLLGRLRA